MITDSWLRANSGKSTSKPYEKTDRDGLSARVSEKGKIAWQIRYRFGGKPKRLTLGTYPALSLKQARIKATSLKGELEQGRDPLIVLAQEQIARKAGGDTLADMFMLWYEGECIRKRKKPEDVLSSYRLHVFPKYGAWALPELTLMVWVDVIESIADRTPRIAERILLAAKQMYRFLIRRGRIQGGSPIEHLSATGDFGITRRSLHRSLSDNEIKVVLDGVNNSRLSEKNRIMIKLLLLYGCRPQEMRIAKKEHFDFEKKIWTIPPENHKTGKKTNQPLLRPITKVAELLIGIALDEISGESPYLFPARGKSEPVTDTAMLSISSNVIKWLEKHRNVTMQHWSLYDLRKTARTNWSRITQPHIAEIMLGHKLPGSWQVYDHYTYLDEQREALEQWEGKLLQLGMMER